MIAPDEQQIEITPIGMATVDLVLIGDSELIIHAVSKDTLDEMEKDRMKDPNKPDATRKKSRKPLDPIAEFEGAKYYLDDGREGIKTDAFKGAFTGAARDFPELTLVGLKTAIIVHGEMNNDGVCLIPIEGESKMRRDSVRIGGATKVMDLRYRPGYWPWRVKVRVTFNTNVLSVEQFFNLVEAAGYGGVGDWRPSAPKSLTGWAGRFHVAREGEL